jgi:hypothetical protein
LHPNEERPHGFWEVDDPPDPTVAQTSADFAAELGVLLRWSQLPVAEIEHRARAYGGYLPEGALSEALRGNTLPSEELLVQVLWAVGCDDQTVGLWVWARSNLAAAQAHFDPTDVFWVPDEAQKYSDGALAEAVQERGDQGGWRGLHRHAVPDGGDTKYTPKRLRTKDSSPSTSWAMISLVAAGVLALAAGAVAAFSDGDEVASPPQPGQTCCARPGSQTPPATQATDTATTTPDPNTSTRPVVNPTPRPSTTTPGTSPTPTQTQAQNPRLTASGNATCTDQGGMWVVTVTVDATLTEAASGSNPEGRAGLTGGAMGPFSVSGSGTDFSGQATIEVGPSTEPASGSVKWTVTVTVPPGATVGDEGEESFSCPSA